MTIMYCIKPQQNKPLSLRTCIISIIQYNIKQNKTKRKKSKQDTCQSHCHRTPIQLYFNHSIHCNICLLHCFFIDNKFTHSKQFKQQNITFECPTKQRQKQQTYILFVNKQSKTNCQNKLKKYVRQLRNT